MDWFVLDYIPFVSWYRSLVYTARAKNILEEKVDGVAQKTFSKENYSLKKEYTHRARACAVPIFGNMLLIFEDIASLVKKEPAITWPIMEAGKPVYGPHIPNLTIPLPQIASHKELGYESDRSLWTYVDNYMDLCRKEKRDLPFNFGRGSEIDVWVLPLQIPSKVLEVYVQKFEQEPEHTKFYLWHLADMWMMTRQEIGRGKISDKSDYSDEINYFVEHFDALKAQAFTHY